MRRFLFRCAISVLLVVCSLLAVAHRLWVLNKRLLAYWGEDVAAEWRYCAACWRAGKLV